MGAKDRITAYVCTSADGSQKLPMAIIGKSKNPRCFRLGPSQVPYFSQRSAWSDTATFMRWFEEVFLVHVRRTTRKDVVLIMDNCGPHGADLVDTRGQVKIIPLPPNCTSVHQPMDQGVIAAWKAKYRFRYLTELLENKESQQARRERSKNRKAGMKGMEEGYDPHMLDVSRLVAASWDDVSVATIARCWRKASILPASHEADILNLHGKIKKRSDVENKAAEEIVACFSKLSLSSAEQLMSSSDIPRMPKIEETRVWLDVETNEDVQEALIDDTVLEIEDEATATRNGDVSDEDDDGPEVIPVVPIPLTTTISGMFERLEGLAYDANVPGASMYLRRAKRAFAEARASRTLSQPRQKLITELFTAKK